LNREEVGNTRWFIPFEQLFMYQLKKTPPNMRLNDYIVGYTRTGDEQYLASFLHHYETMLNIRTKKYRNYPLTHGHCYYSKI